MKDGIAPVHLRNVARSTVTVAGLAAAGWLVLGLESLARHEPRQYRDGLFLAPWALYAATIAGIHLLQRHRGGRLERWGFRAVMGAMALTAVGNVGIVLGSDTLRSAAFPLGPVGFVLGMAAFGLGTNRAGMHPRRVGTLIALAQPLTMATGLALSPVAGLHETGSYPGAMFHGVVLLLLVAVLRRAEGRTNPPADRPAVGVVTR